MIKILLIAGLIISLTGCVSGSGIGRTEKFKKPDIKDDFCGVHINYQFCKCAFHDKFCDAIGMDEDGANSYVQSEYKKWLAELREKFATSCLAAGGISEGDTCDYCKEGFMVKDDECVFGEGEEEEEEEEEEEFKADGPLTNDCKVIEEEFNSTWKKYSDIDNRIPFGERSYEAKQALMAYDTMIELMVEGFEVERNMELEQLMINELSVYREALVQNIKTNLLKSFWRLSWITFKTIEGGKGIAGSYNTLFTTGSAVEAVGSGLKVIQGLTPADAPYAIDTRTATGKVKSVGVNTALEAVASLGDPVKIATELFKSSANAPLPSADLTPEEINILRDQHINKGVIDDILREARIKNAERAARIIEIEKKIVELKNEIEAFEAAEKIRVKNSLEGSCETLKDQFNKD